MGLCASRALGVLENLEEEMREEEESSSNSSLQIVSEASSAAAGGMSMSSSSSSSNGGTRRSMRSMMRSRNSTTLFKATATTTTLSFDSSRSSAEVGEMGKLGALLCKRRPFVGNPDILSAHLTNLLNSMLLQRTTAQETKSPAEISFASYLSTPFIRPQGTFFQRQFYNAMEDDDDDRDDGGGLNAIAKSYAESAAKAAARDTFLFLEKNDRSLQSFEITVEEEEEEEEIQEEEEEETSRVAMSSSDDSHHHHPGTVDLFRPHGMYCEQEEEEEEEIVEIAAAAAAQHKSYSFQFSYPATTTTTSSRWASVVNAARQSSAAWLPRRPASALEAAAALKTVEKKKKKKKIQGQEEGSRGRGGGDEIEEEGKKKKAVVLVCDLGGGSSSSSGTTLGLERGRLVPAASEEGEDQEGEATTTSSSPILGCVAAACCSRTGELRKSSSETSSTVAATPDIPRDSRTRGNSGSDSAMMMYCCRSKMICEESSTSSIGKQPSMLLKTTGTISERRRSSSELAAPKSENSGSDSETPAEVTCLQDADSKLGQEHLWGCKQVAEEDLEAADAGERGDWSRSCVDDPSCSSSSRMCGHPTQYQPQHEEEEEEVPDNPDSSFFSFPSSPSSKLFEEVGSGHIIEQMKSTKLMQEMACRKAVEEFQQEVGGFEGHPRCHAESAAGAHSRNVAFGSPFAVAAAATRSCQMEEVEMMTTTTMTTQERAAPRSCQFEEARITTHERAAAAAHSSFDKRLKFFSLERACNAAISKRFVVLESIASAQDTTCFSHPRDGHHATSSHESSCESFRIDDNTQGVRMMSFTRKDFACLQMKKCVGVNAMADLPSGTATAASESGTLRNLIHGSKAVRKASTRAKSLKDTPKKPKYLEQVEESAATSLSSTGKGLVLLKLGLLRRKHLAVKNTAEKSVSPTINPSPSVSISRSVDVENKPP
ncbi:unnamed protein product [Sphagnum jensenii]|uniref:Uncharacterized protein n=1 Tax=Sphagnum jensenii TaxID=128206 RepID=A0ABP1BML9_9BRYO